MGLTGLRPSGRKDHSKKSKRKVEKKLQFHAKVKDAVVALGAKKAISKSSKSKRKRRQKKLEAYDLTSLAEFLPDLAAASQHPPEATITKLNRKSRKKLLQRESVQLKAVLNNPTFQMDPVSAIQYHLERTQPPPPMDAHREKKHNRPGKTKKKSKSRKKGANESSLDPQSHMDI